MNFYRFIRSSYTRCCVKPRFFCSLPPLTPLKLPSASETHLWYVVPDEFRMETLLFEYLRILPQSDQREVFRVIDEELIARELLSCVLARTTIARYMLNSQPLVTPASLEFKMNADGKPEIKWQENDEIHPPLQFNMSHTSSLIGCGITTSGPIGIHVMEKSQVMGASDALFNAQRFFSDQEVQFLAALDPTIQRQEFFKLWALKVAYVKALGKNVSNGPLNTFTILSKCLPNGTFPLLNDPGFEASDIVVESAEELADHKTNWEFTLLELANSHYASICRGHDSLAIGGRSKSTKLSVWKTVPFREDHHVYGTKTKCSWEREMLEDNICLEGRI